MNDFTKEELMYIADTMLYSISNLESRAEIIIKIREKILKMIDNYCAHESDGLVYHQWFGEEKYNCQLCKKCGKLYRDNK